MNRTAAMKASMIPSSPAIASRRAEAPPVSRSVDRLEDVQVDAASGLHIGMIMIGAQPLRIHGRGRNRPALVDRRPLEPRQEHLPDGHRVEPRHDRLRLHAQLWATVRGAGRHRAGRGGLRFSRRRAAGQHLPGTPAQYPSSGATLLFIIAARSYEADKQRLADIHLSVDDAAPKPALA